ncbi:MAG: hypothetical protein IT280_09055 [Ignavibacteria bacterium]|nr:hypothetical protein [Ignavibacteria bacterium]
MKLKIGFLLLFFSLILCGIFFYPFNNAKLAGFYAVKYFVEYSPDSTFKYISERKEFYNRARDNYYLKPNQVDKAFWINKGPGVYGSDMQKFARIKAVVNDSTFYLTAPIKFMGCIFTFK